MAVKTRRGKGRPEIPYSQRSPLQWRQPHDPTIWEERVLERKIDPFTGKTTELKRAVYRRSSRDAMIWGRFTQAQEDAAIAIAEGRDVVIDGRGVKAQSFVPAVDGGRGTGEDETARKIMLAKRYKQWMDECPKHEWIDEDGKVHHGIVNSYVIGVVCLGMSLREARQVYRKRDETIRDHLMRGLDLYASMFG